MNPVPTATRPPRLIRAFTTTTRAGGTSIRQWVPPFKWWRILRTRKVLEEYFIDHFMERRHARGTNMLTVLFQNQE